MSSFRVTERSIANKSLTGLQRNLSRLGDLQEQLSSGKNLTRPSDSPTGTVSAMQLRSEIRVAEQHVRNAEDGVGWLSTIDNTLTQASGQLNRVRDLVLQAKSAGSASAPGAREAIAAEVNALRDSLLSLANTRYVDRPVFGGTTDGSDAYDANGDHVSSKVFATASGTTPAPPGEVYRTVSSGAAVRVDIDGPSVFGSDTSNIFKTLDSIVEHIRADDVDALDADLGKLDSARNQIIGSLADVGARQGRIEAARDAADNRLIDLKNQLSEIEDIDLPKTITELTLAQTAYQAALGATAKIVQPSLLDFLR